MICYKCGADTGQSIGLCGACRVTREQNPGVKLQTFNEENSDSSLIDDEKLREDYRNRFCSKRDIPLFGIFSVFLRSENPFVVVAGVGLVLLVFFPTLYFRLNSSSASSPNKSMEFSTASDIVNEARKLRFPIARSDGTKILRVSEKGLKTIEIAVQLPLSQNEYYLDQKVLQREVIRNGCKDPMLSPGLKAGFGIVYTVYLKDGASPAASVEIFSSNCT